MVWRVEQAAYDVLFNKKVWRSADSERRSMYTWRCGIGRDEVFMAQGSTPTLGAQLPDGFGTFPLYIGGLSAIPTEWWIGAQREAPPAIDRAAGNP